jgi:hypothetical protein
MAFVEDSISSTGLGVEARFYLRATMMEEDASENPAPPLELNGKTALLTRDCLVARLRPDSPSDLRRAREGAHFLLEICYSTEQKVMVLEGRLKWSKARPGYCKMKFQLCFAHPKHTDRWLGFYARVVEKFGGRKA